MIKFVLLTIILLSLGYVVYADTIYLQNGKKVVGKIIEKTGEYTKIDLDGITVTYWADEISKIDFESVKQMEDTGSNFRRGTGYLEEGKWQQAMDEFKNAISLDSKNAGAHFNLGCVYALTGEYDSAIEEFVKAASLEQVPFNAFCYFNIAGAYVKRAMVDKDAELFKKAAENFEKSAKILPNFILAMDYARHSATFSSTELIKTFNTISFFVNESGIPPDSIIFLSETKIKNSGETRNCFFDATTPPLLYFYRSPSTYYLVCISKMDFQNLANVSEDVAMCLKDVLGLVDNDSESRFNKLIKWNIFSLLSNYYMYKKQWDEAIECGEKVKSLGVDSSETHTRLAMSYFLKGDYPKANESAKRALEINPAIESRDSLEDIIKKTETAK